MAKDEGFVLDEREYAQFRRGVVAGVTNICHAVEGHAKRITPVHGDSAQGGQFRTFAPGEKPIGGTLRRSIHTVVMDNGKRMNTTVQKGGGGGKEKREAIREMSPSNLTGSGIEGMVGTSLSYAGYVHDGTVHMDERPFLATAFSEEQARVETYFRAGFDKFVK